MTDVYIGDNEKLVQIINQWTQGKSQFKTPITGLTLYRKEQPTQLNSTILDASLCLIAQGEKQVILGEKVYTYDSNHFLFTAIDLPIITQIIEASPEQPYLGVILRLDPYVLAQLMLEAHIPFKHTNNEKKGVAVGLVTSELNDAFVRLLKLLETPQDISILSPLIIKEIFYRLLMSPQGEQLKRIAATGATGHRIVKAIEWLKTNFAKSFNVEELASTMGMSTSSFHQHFRDMTLMSPLQYQKRIRLTEARRLLMTEDSDISSASIQVGYESLSQFSREYKRFFGTSPSEDIKHISK
ncbi:AraC family transcriptional regulator [Acinetobacter puyangensis]|uniref:Transcriptional regulator, AraC family n=1 Tax=Acinetobacter puyangensis TaxID=1096779 RepID=A0A240E6C2_9GAMM|nr:AraC family transcriptional regulator [Acinetobacter puyangensis]SNX44307.1 transcriptional regulator, AraC family [Acinetobacter puyangensis]